MWITFTCSLCASAAHCSRVLGLPALTPVSGQIQQRLLDEVRHHAGIRAVREHGRRTVRVRLAQRERFFAQRVDLHAGREIDGSV